MKSIQAKSTVSPDHPESSSAKSPTTPEQARLLEAMTAAADMVAPVWPLRDYVAVNPLDGLTDRTYLEARAMVRAWSDADTLMPLEFYRQQYQQGHVTEDDIRDVLGSRLRLEREISISVEQVLAAVRANVLPEETLNNPERRIESVAEMVDRVSETDWVTVVRQEIGRHCASHYDEGVATWKSPWRGQGLFQAWRSRVAHEYTAELNGLKGFRGFVGTLPESSNAALPSLLSMLGVPADLWSPYLCRMVQNLPGWSGWALHRVNQADVGGSEGNDFADLIAIQLVYENAVASVSGLEIDWNSIHEFYLSVPETPDYALARNSAEVRYVLQCAVEHAYQRQLVDQLTPVGLESVGGQRPLIEACFCIDVRSERIRRQLHHADNEIRTNGMAGFFGVPVSFELPGQDSASPHAPAIISPSIRATAAGEGIATVSTGHGRIIGWKMQKSAVGAFAFVESTGLTHFPALVWKSVARFFPNPGFTAREASAKEVSLKCEHGHPLSLDEKVKLAAGILKAGSSGRALARLFVLCGHGSEIINNPLKASLDCGACGGHSGALNASLAVSLLNDPEVRDGLGDLNIKVPRDTWFAAALHNTVTDEIELLNPEGIPASHFHERERFEMACRAAAGRSRDERAPSLGAGSGDSLVMRAQDWAEVRPEWGLTGNAAFVAGPGSIVGTSELAGRVFLHNYAQGLDPEHEILEQILTGPLIVAHWINMQYLTSTVDNEHFGSGTKTLHNIVGNFGLLSGGGGDLKAGLPWQSVGNEGHVQHTPLRLTAVLFARREAVEGILRKHPGVQELAANSWINLMVRDEAGFHCYTRSGNWVQMDDRKAESWEDEPLVESTTSQPDPAR